MKKLFSRKSNTSAVEPRRRAALTVGTTSDPPTESVQPVSAYRRNRTITGSSSASVASSNEYNAELRSPRAHVHHLTRARRKLFGRLLLVCMVAVAIYLFLSQTIASVAVSAGTATLSADRQKEYQAHLDSYFNKYPLERLLFNVNSTQLLQYISSKYPEISAIHLDTSGILGRAHGFVTLRAPIAKWSLRGTNEFVDQQGVVFGYNGYTEPTLQIVDSTGTTTASGIVTSDRFLAFVGRVVGATKVQGYNVTEAIIPPLTTRQLEIKVEGVPYRVKYTIDRGAGEQAEDMAQAIKYLQGKGVTPEYIDVRVQGRAAYK